MNIGGAVLFMDLRYRAPMKRVALLSSLLVACVSRPAEDDAGATTMLDGESTDESTSEPSTNETSADESESSTDESESSTDDGDGDGDDEACHEPRKLDIPSDDEAPMPESCTVEMIPWPTPEQYPGCEICEFESICHYQAYLGCVTPLSGETCADICPEGDCLSVYWESCEGEFPLGVPNDTCGYYEIDGKCCTIGKFLDYCAE